ncbi:MAG: hypothetical protein AVDCRST_MAG55-550, partial [uncultured Rubrobacteraceae bacterium]
DRGRGRPQLRRRQRPLHLRVEDREGVGGPIPPAGGTVRRRHHQRSQLQVHQV